MRDDAAVHITLELTVDTRAVAEFFNNQSVGAFLGAFAAFMLVAANDWRRERRKVKTLRAEIEVNLSDARAKLETARRMRDLMRKENRVTPAPVLRFNTSFTRQLSAEVLHHLTLDQRRAVEALCYTMEAIDGLFSEATGSAKALSGPMDNSRRMTMATDLLATWGDIVANLKRLIEMCEDYLAGRFTQMVTKQYNVAEYEEA